MEVTIEVRVERILALDLGPIKFKLVHDNDHGTISLAEINELELRYKRFLILCLKHRGKKIVADKRVDMFWHTHILDTEKYAVDCGHILGFFMHHFPYFGLRGAQDAQDLKTLSLIRKISISLSLANHIISKLQTVKSLTVALSNVTQQNATTSDLNAQLLPVNDCRKTIINRYQFKKLVAISLSMCFYVWQGFIIFYKTIEPFHCHFIGFILKL